MPALRYGNYDVLEGPDGKPWTLGAGGFGRAYKARHRFLHQMVALKVISEALLEDEQASARFLREAQVVHKLVHPNIAHVDDFGELDGTLYYAMEFCEGGDLVQWRKRVGGSVSLEQVVACARQIAAALGCAHQAGWLHRDVKPGNIMLANQELPTVFKLVDFGLVKSAVPRDANAGGPVTLDGRHFFTLAYASPEQLREETLDGRTDIFSLGMTIWFLLLGTDPETGALGRVISRRLGPDSYFDQLPTFMGESFRALLGWMLEKDRDRRCPDAAELLTALNDLQLPDPTDYQAAVQGWSPSVEQPTGSIHATFELQEAGASTTDIGKLFEGIDRRTSQPVSVTFLNEGFVANHVRMAEVRNTTSLLRSNIHPSLLGVLAFEHYSEGWAIVRERATGVRLRQVLNSNGLVPFPDAMRVLSPLAESLDFVDRLKAPGLALSADDIVVEPAQNPASERDLAALASTPVRAWPPIKVRVQPLLFAKPEKQTTRDQTSLSSMRADSRVEFSSLLYWLVSGQPPPPAARQARTAYLPVAGLSAGGNQRLAAGLANQTDTNSCLELLRSICDAEEIAASVTVAKTAQTSAAIPAPTVSPDKPPGTIASSGISPTVSGHEGRETAKAPTPSTPPPSVSAPPAPIPQAPGKAKSPLAPVASIAGSTGPVTPAAPPRFEEPAATRLDSGRGTVVPNSGRSRLGLALATLVLLAVGAGIWLWTKGGNSNANSVPAKPVVAAPAPVSNAAPVAETTPLPAVRPDPNPARPAGAVTLTIPFARIPGNAVFLLGNTPLVPGKLNGAHRIVIPPADFNKVLQVSAPGYETFSIDRLATVQDSEIKPMTREAGTLLVSTADGQKSDYTRLKIVLKSVFPAGTERQPAEMNERIEELAALVGTAGKEIKLPTGDYELIVMGREGEEKSIKPHILPAAGGIVQVRRGSLKISIPATFSGKYELRQELPEGKGTYRLFDLTLPGIAGTGTMRQTDYRANGAKFREIDFTIFGMELDADGKLLAKVESTKDAAIKKKVEFRAQFSFVDGKLRCENVPGEIAKNKFRFDLTRSVVGDRENR